MVRGVLQHVAGFVFAPDRRSVKPKARRFAHDQAKFLRRNFGAGAFLHSKRRDAKCAQRWFETRHRRNGSFNPDVIGVCRAASNADAVPLTDPAIISGSARDGEIETVDGFDVGIILTQLDAGDRWFHRPADITVTAV